MALSSDNAIMVLRLLAECGRLSRTGLIDIMPFSYRNKCVVIKKLVDDRYIRQCGDQLKTSSYTLMSQGREELKRLNPQRYTDELFELEGLLKRHCDRAKRRGDVAAAMSLAGYAVHPEEKPALPATTPEPVDLTLPALKALFHNKRPQPYGDIFSDHTRRVTPICCYYDSGQIKGTREIFTNQGTNYSRATGVLFTPSHLFRVYHGEQKNLQINPTGEEHFYALVEEVFQGYIPEENKAVLLFGREFAPAESLLDIYLNDKRDIRTSKMLLNPYNLGTPLHYLPHMAQSLDLLRIMGYPDWHKSINTFASELMFGIVNQQAWSYVHEGRHIYILADLNLSNAAKALREIWRAPNQPAEVICLNWQMAFFEELLRYAGNDSKAVWCSSLPDDFLTDTVIALEDYWNNNGST